MKIIKTLLTSLTLAFFLFSCQKEASFQNGNGNDKLSGKWNFVGMTATVKTTTVAGSGADQEKIISSYDLTAINPVGTVTIDASKFVTNGISYSMDTKISTELYDGGVVFDSFETPLTMTMPASSAFTTYTAIGEDSVYLQNGFIAFDPAATIGGGTGAPMATLPQGFKISWQNDTMVLKSVVSHNMTQNINGVSAQILVDAKQIVKLKK